MPPAVSGPRWSDHGNGERVGGSSAVARTGAGYPEWRPFAPAAFAKGSGPPRVSCMAPRPVTPRKAVRVVLGRRGRPEKRVTLVPFHSRRRHRRRLRTPKASRTFTLLRPGKIEEAAEFAIRGAEQPNAHIHARAIAVLTLETAGRRDEADAQWTRLKHLHPITFRACALTRRARGRSLHAFASFSRCAPINPDREASHDRPSLLVHAERP